MNGVRRQHRDTGVLVFEVVPVKETATVLLGGGDVGKSLRKRRSVFKRFKLGLRIRIVIAGMRPVV